MLITTTRRETYTAMALLLLLGLTRSGITRTHFGDHLSLPDASWALFWLAGLLTTRMLWPVLLMVACVLIDYLVIAQGVSSYCFTPAYPFLIPAYGSLWYLGRKTTLPRDATTWFMAGASLTLGVSLCFVISNVGFYWASGYFANLPFSRFAGEVAHYWPAYLGQTALYAGSGVALVRFIQAVTRNAAADLRA